MRTYSGSAWQRLSPEMREVLAPMDRFLREISPAFARVAQGRAPEGSGVTLGSPVQGLSVSQTSLPNYLYLPDSEGGVQTVVGDVVFSGSVTFSRAEITYFTDDKFYILDADDQTKQANFSCVAISTGTLRTYTFPDDNGTLVLKDSANTFTRGLTIDNIFTAPGDVLLKLIPDVAQSSDILQIRNFGDSANLVSVNSAGLASFGPVVSPTAPVNTSVDASGGAISALTLEESSSGAQVTFEFAAALTGSRAYTLPDAAGTLLLSGGTATVGFQMRSNTSSSGVSFRDQTTNTKQFRFILSGAVGNNTVTLTNSAARNYGLGDLSGNVVVVGDDAPAVASGGLGKVDLSAQVADITTTALSSTPPAGVYEVEVYLMCTTAAATAGTLTVTLGWTDNVGATTSTPITAFTLAATGRTTGRQLVRVASGDITYAVAVTGLYSTSDYAVYVRVLSLG